MRAREDARDRYGVARLRRRLGLGQVQFASRYRIPLSTLRQWEQGVEEPDAASKLLLAVIAAEPELIARVAASQHPGSFNSSGRLELTPSSSPPRSAAA